LLGGGLFYVLSGVLRNEAIFLVGELGAEGFQALEFGDGSLVVALGLGLVAKEERKRVGPSGNGAESCGDA